MMEYHESLYLRLDITVEVILLYLEYILRTCHPNAMLEYILPKCLDVMRTL